MKIRRFAALRPAQGKASQVASPPYDVIDSQEARALASGNEASFLHIVKPEIDLPEGTNLYADEVYAKAAENFQRFQKEGLLVREPEPTVYLYRQSFQGHAQTGLVCVCHVEDYEKGLIKKHEKTLQKKEDDRTRHVSTLKANAGPVFLMYRDSEEMQLLVDALKESEPDVDFVSPDKVRHTTWRVDQPEIFEQYFERVPATYVADGHHRSASAARCAQEMAAANPNHSGEEDYNWYLCVLFPADELQVLAYNRLVADLNGQDAGTFLAAVQQHFTTEPVSSGQTEERGDIRMFVDDQWYKLTRELEEGLDPVAALDVSILQKHLLAPVLGVDDPRTNNRISFKGGYNCVEVMENLVRDKRAAVAFSLYPTSTGEVMSVADADMIMPPKSTWFEPKLRSGLFVHTLDT